MAVETRRIDIRCDRAEEIGENKFRYKWPFTRDDFCSKKDVGLISPIFSTGPDNELRWRMKMSQKSTSRRDRNLVSVSICLVPSRKHVRVQATFTLSFINGVNSTVGFHKISNSQKFVPGTAADLCEFYHSITSSRGRNNDFDSDRFTIVCELEDPLVSSAINIPEHRFLDNLQPLFDNEKLSDVTLMISGQEFRAHKVILSMYSSVFSAMFEHEMAERIHDEVKISDITPEVFKEMLRFMYTGEVLGIERIADVLLVAADKYAIERLKAMCEDALYKNIDMENAADTLILSDKHNADQLKTMALKFVVSCATNVIATPGFQSMAQSHPHLVFETLHELAISASEQQARYERLLQDFV